MHKKIIKLKGSKKGPTSMILVGVHGDEICGVKAIEKILPSLKIESGQVFIGYGNPNAIKKNVRYTGANLNRMFKEDKLLSKKERGSYEYKRAQFLKKYFNKAEVLLDVHASFTPKSKKFIICEPNAHEITKYLPFKTTISGFDKVEPGGTDHYMNQLGKIGICIECGYLKDKSSEKIAESGILSFLSARGHIKKRNTITKQEKIKMYYLYKTKSANFELNKKFLDLEKITKGQLIGIDGGKKMRASKDGMILFARNMKNKGDEAFFLCEYK